MSLEHMLRDEEELLKLFLREEFGMSDNFFIQHPEVTRYILEHEAESHQMTAFEQLEIMEAWNELQAVPSYVEQQAAAWAAEIELEVEA